MLVSQQPHTISLVESHFDWKEGQQPVWHGQALTVGVPTRRKQTEGQIGFAEGDGSKNKSALASRPAKNIPIQGDCPRPLDRSQLSQLTAPVLSPGWPPSP